MPLSPAETARKVADIVDYETERFDMGTWELQADCGTTACIAGHTALLHQDGLDSKQYRQDAFIHPDGKRELVSTDTGWKDRQAGRLGLTGEAGDLLFHEASNIWNWDEAGDDPEDKTRFSKVLRQIEKELADRDADDLIDEDELKRIAEEARD